MKGLLIAMAALLPLMSFASQDSCIYGVRPVSYTINSSHDVGTEELVFSLYISSSKDISIPEVATNEVFENVDLQDNQAHHILSHQDFKELRINKRGEFYVGMLAEEVDFLLSTKLLAQTRIFKVQELDFDEDSSAFHTFESEEASVTVSFRQFCEA
tara:strand:+ start:133 stop:603 length:471 start_codon:yes stop_codon:yes gene_type:complete